MRRCSRSSNPGTARWRRSTGCCCGDWTPTRGSPATRSPADPGSARATSIAEELAEEGLDPLPEVDVVLLQQKAVALLLVQHVLDGLLVGLECGFHALAVLDRYAL